MSNANTVSLSNLTSKNFNPNINKVSAEKHYVTPDEFTSMNQEYEREELIAVDYENELSSEEWETRNSSVDDYVFTFTTSFAFGILEPVENVIDGLVMTGGEIASFCCEITGQEEPAEFIKQNTKNLVGYDWTEAGYDAVVNTLELDEEVAHGDLHQVGTMLGSITGYAAISLTFGGVGNAILGYLSAKGSSAENAFNSGATFEEAQVTSNVAGIVGAASGYGLNKIQQAATGTQSMKGVAGYTSLGAFVSTAEPVANSIAEYATYGHDLVDENGNPLYENFGDYYVNSGGLLNTGIAFGVGGISTGSKATSGYKVNNDVKNYKINVEEFSESIICKERFEQLKNNNIDGPLRLDSQEMVSVMFNDPKQFMISKLNDLSQKYAYDSQLVSEIEYLKHKFSNEGINIISDEDVYNSVFKYLEVDDQKIVNDMYASGLSPTNRYTFEEKDLIQSYTYSAGPAITAYCRGTKIEFKGRIFDGTSKFATEDYIARGFGAINKLESLSDNIEVDKFVNKMDEIINKSNPIPEDMIVYRSVNGLYCDGNKLSTFDVGQRFNDKAYVSTSALPTKISSNSNILLEIEVPKGTKAAYLESFTGVKNYGQQEILLGRNSEFEISDVPVLKNNGQVVLKVKLV